jgi:rSAM/selenodomain-associated transferase 2
VNGRAEGPKAHLRISVVVPSWRDAENLESLLPGLAGRERIAEIIVVDASGDEKAERITLASGATFIACPTPNRGEQMNLGAAASSGDVILFQHCDTCLDDAHLEAIALALADPEIVGGAFFRKFDGRHPRLMWLESVARFLTRHGGTLYGDQSIFVRRDVFQKLGGFAKIPLMEDLEFSRRLRGAGKIAVLDPPVASSARRHLRKGAWRTSIQNGLFIVLYKLGVSPYRLHRWYYGGAKSQTREASSVAAVYDRRSGCDADQRRS